MATLEEINHHFKELFKKKLRKHKNLFMKYQYYHYLKKRFIVPKRFFIDGKKFYEMIKEIKSIIDGIDKDILIKKKLNQDIKTKLKIISDKLTLFKINLDKVIEGRYSGTDYVLSIHSFVSRADIAKAHRHNSLFDIEKYNNDTKWPFQYRNYDHDTDYVFHSENFEKVDPKLVKYRKIGHDLCDKSSYKIIYTMLLTYQLLLHLNNKDAPYLKNFMQDMGFIPANKKTKKQIKK